MDPMLFVIAFDSMQRQLDENARLRLLRARADVIERQHPFRALVETLALRVRTGRARPATARTPVGDLDCCPT